MFKELNMTCEITTRKLKANSQSIYYRATYNQKAYNKLKNYYRFHYNAEISGGSHEHILIQSNHFTIDVINTKRYHHFHITVDSTYKKEILMAFGFFRNHATKNTIGVKHTS